MADFDENVEKIRSSKYGKDVREAIAEGLEEAYQHGGGGGSTVTMVDNSEGGVDLSVDGTTRTLAKQSDLTTANDAIESLDSVVGDAIVLESNEEVSSHRVVEESDLVLYATKAYVDGLIGNLDTLIGTGVIE